MCEFLINKENISNMLINISVTGQLLSVQVHLIVKPKRFYRVLLQWSKIFQTRMLLGQVTEVPRTQMSDNFFFLKALADFSVFIKYFKTLRRLIACTPLPYGRENESQSI